MSKIVIITDLHLGIHKNNLKFLKSQMDYFENEFIPYLKNNNIKKVFILGDIFDNRQSLNIFVFREFLRKFFDKMKSFELHILLGNHDIYYNTEISVHSLDLFKDYENVNIYENIEKITIDNREILMIPWQIGNFSITEKADIAMGHLDLSGFNMYKQKISDEGISPIKFYENFKLTFSGHFHIRSIKTNNYSDIIYVGSPYQLTRNDSGEDRGFVVLDLETLKYEFIDNKNCIKFITVKYPQEITKEMIQGNVVDVNIEYNKDYNEQKFKDYLSKIENFEPVFPPIPKIINNFLEISEDKNIDIINVSLESVISEYIKECLDINNRSEIENLMKDIYSEAKEVVI